ncbi:unnamed protein product [Rotaria sp. Silwood1]|nr:unnamed protein product [Rotaria sp. Silwood1]CAF4887534.1 unnamed protein product [Rotaria sp. Silwood1]
MISNTLNQLLFLLPSAIHDKTIEIYNRIPGTLMRFLGTNTVTKEVECKNGSLITGKLTVTDDNEYPTNLPGNFDDFSNETRYNNYEKKSSRKNASDTASNKYMDKSPDMCVSYTSSNARTIPIEYNKDWDIVRQHLKDSIQRKFYEKQIIEINPDHVADEILKRYLQESSNSNKQRKNSSSIIKFNETYCINSEQKKINIGEYNVTAYIILENETSWNMKHRTYVSYDYKLELNGISQDSDKLNQFNQLVATNDVSTAIQQIQGQTQLTWQSFFKPPQL